MSERLKIRSYDERDSSKLGVGDYIKKHVISIFLPFIGFGVGFGLRKITKLQWLEQPYVFPFYTPRVVRAGVEESAKITGQYVGRNAETWGMKIGAFWGVYNLWRDKRKSQYGIDDVAKRVEQLKQFESANSYLARENEELRQQITFLDRNPPFTVTSDHSHEGVVKDATRAAESARH